MFDIRSILLRQQDIVNKVIDFFLAEAINPKNYEEIKQICLQNSTKIKRQNQETFVNLGYFSVMDFLLYMDTKKMTGNGIKVKLVEMTLELLAERFIINEMESVVGSSPEPRFKPSIQYAKVAYENDLIFNLIFGFPYIIQKYQSSVFKIEHIDKNDVHSIGTGFLMNGDNQDVIVTNRHVIENFKKLIVLDKDDRVYPYKKLVIDDKADLGLIFINSFKASTFVLNENIEVMSEIITIGYPSIPMTKYAHQVYHKGEVNSFVEDYQSNKLFLFSAKTSSGNSGSPVIDRNGMVIGIVTEELFEKDQFYEKGKLPYYAAIPAVEIERFLTENW